MKKIKTTDTKAEIITKETADQMRLAGSFGAAVPIDTAHGNDVSVRGRLNGCSYLLDIRLDSAYDRNGKPRRVRVTVSEVLP